MKKILILIASASLLMACGVTLEVRNGTGVDLTDEEGVTFTSESCKKIEHGGLLDGPTSFKTEDGELTEVSGLDDAEDDTKYDITLDGDDFKAVVSTEGCLGPTPDDTKTKLTTVAEVDTLSESDLKKGKEAYEFENSEVEGRFDERVSALQVAPAPSAVEGAGVGEGTTVQALTDATAALRGATDRLTAAKGGVDAGATPTEGQQGAIDTATGEVNTEKGKVETVKSEVNTEAVGAEAAISAAEAAIRAADAAIEAVPPATSSS